MRQLFEPWAAPAASGLSHGNPRQYAAIATTFLRWVLLGTISGLLAGPASAIFLVTLRWASRVHSENPWLLALLPLAGVAIYLLYSHVGGVAERGNNLLIEEVHLNRQDVPLRMAPLSFLAPVITLLFGGSIASVGTAVQMGGTLADWLARTLHLSKEERRVMLMAGLSGGFGSVISTPLAGAIFGMEVQSVGRIRYEGIVPCLTSSIVGYAIVRTLGAYGSTYPLLPAMEVDALLLLKVTLAGVAFGLCGLLFIEFTHATSFILNRIVRRQFWLKPVLGGCAIIALALLPGAQAYLGLSQPLLTAVWGGASIATFAFLWKLIFTGLTVGSGFKGGEITPLFIMGAALGYVLAQPLGAPPQLLAAIGFAAVFAGASNTPLACAVMAVELFGSGGFVYMLVGTVTSYIFSGHRSIYTTQRVDTPKFIFEVPRRFAVRDIMTRALATVTPHTPLPEVLSLLKQRQVKSVIVLNGVDGAGEPVQGIVTAGDLFRHGGLSLRSDLSATHLHLVLAQGKVAQDVMTPNPVSVRDNASLDEASRLMTRQRLKRLPVINDSKELVGVISRSDILRCVASEAHMQIDTPLLTAIDPQADTSLVRGWMRTNVASAKPDDPFAVVLERLVADSLRRVVVVDDEQRVVGIIIDADLLDRISGLSGDEVKVAVQRWQAGDTSVALSLRDEITANDLMSPVVYTVYDDTRPIDVIQTMIERRVKRLVVVDRENHLLGMVDRQDMLRSITNGGG
ncbi:MAG: chloride channel protein [Chloroflexi bacterium]|nr:chloride channel protein [Chloroflexota bacterium]